MKKWLPFAEPLAWGAAAVLGALLLAVAVSRDSPLIGPGVIGLLCLAIWLAWGNEPRRMLIAGLYFLAPIDVSKAIIPPVDRFFSPGLYLTAGHAVLIVMTLAWLVRRLLVERRRLPMTAVDALAFVFLAWIGLRSIGTLQGTLAMASAFTYALAVLAFYVSSHALESAADLRLAMRAVVFGLAAEALWVAAQMATHTPLGLPGSKGAVQANGDVLLFGGAGSAFRPPGFFDHPNALADHMTLLIPPALALVLLGSRRLDARIWRTALGVLAVACALLLVTLSRGGWAAAVLGGAWVVYRFVDHRLTTPRQLAQMVIASGFGLVALMAVYPDLVLRLTAPDDRSTESRLILTNQAFTIIKAHPWIGVGYGGYNRAAYEYIAPAFANISQEYQQALLQLVVHDHYLLIAAELGLPAMIFFAYLLYRFITLARPWRSWRDPTSFAMAAGLSGALLTQVLFLASDNFYADIRMFMIWLTAGTLQAVCLQHRRDEA